MPDITSARPVSGQPVATAWGDEVHDQLEGIQAGTATANLSASAFADVVVTFPRAYAVAPVVVACIAQVTPNYFAVATVVTTTQVTLRAAHRDGTTATAPIVIGWIAVGTPA